MGETLNVKSRENAIMNQKKSIFSQRTVKFAHFYPKSEFFLHNLKKIDQDYSCTCGCTIVNDIIVHENITK